MRTTDDVRVLGLYVSDCCAEELIFDKGDTFCRCPKCSRLCEWEPLAQLTRDPEELPVVNTELTFRRHLAAA